MGTTVGSLTAPASFTLAPTLGGAGSQLLTSGSLLAPTTGGGLGSLIGGGGGSLLGGGGGSLLGGGGGSLLAGGAGGLGGLTPGASALMPKLGSLGSTGGLGAASTIDPSKNFLSNAINFAKNPSLEAAGDYIEKHPMASAAGAYGLYNMLKPKPKGPPKDVSLIRPYEFDYNPNAEAYATSPTADSSERLYFKPTFTAQTPYEAPGPEYRKAASGGITSLAIGGPVEVMAAQNAVGANTGYPMANINTAMYSNPMVQIPEATNVISPSSDAGVAAYSGEPRFAKGGLSALGLASYAGDRDAVRTNQNAHSKNINSGSSEKLKATRRAAKSGDFAAYKALQDAGYDMHATSNYAAGGLSDLGGYSDGGRFQKGPGDGVRDSNPAVICDRQPARLDDGEFVVPARIVSELGNGSTEAGARKLYAMMDRVQKARRKTVGKSRVATNTRADKHLPA